MIPQAYNLGDVLRRLASPRPVRAVSLATLRRCLVRVGAEVMRHRKTFILQMAEVAVPGARFAAILDRIDRLLTSPCPG